MRIYKPEDWMNTVLDPSTIQAEVKKNTDNYLKHYYNIISGSKYTGYTN